MRQKTLVTICGVVIAGSMFFPFASLPAPSQDFTPFSRIRAAEPFASLDWPAMLALPPLLLAFIASFFLGALACLLSLLGWTPRLLALAASLTPVGIAAFCWFAGRPQIEALGVTLPTGGFGDAFSQLPQIAGLGFWLWGGAAVLLLLAALLDPGDQY